MVGVIEIYIEKILKFSFDSTLIFLLLSWIVLRFNCPTLSW